MINGSGTDPISPVCVEVTNGQINWIGEETNGPKLKTYQRDIGG